MSAFTYPGKDELPSRARRFATGMILSALLLAAAMLAKPRIDDKTFESLLLLTPLSKEKFENLVANPFAALFVFLGLSWLVSKWVVVEVLEFHLFPWFDRKTLRSVGERTGLLRWTDFAESPAHQASTRLRGWLSDGVHDGAWPFSWVLRGRPELFEKAFGYALLLGPNGVGKSQLAKEVAREKLRISLEPHAGGALSRLRHGLARWFRRVSPRMARLNDDPWHVGEIVPSDGSWSERLKGWRPSAPTVLILDDAFGPCATLARDAIDILDKNSGLFWYSVKLIIVDQFTPTRLDLEPLGLSRCDHLGREIPVLSVPEVRWNGEQTRQVFSGGVWIVDRATKKLCLDPTHDLPEFWQTEALDRLTRALDGNPLMLAEAAVWLAARNAHGRPYRTVAVLLGQEDSEAFEQQLGVDLLSEYRKGIAHRILKERLDDVFTSHVSWAREMVLDERAVVEALCCASLAGGALVSAFEVLNKTQGARLEKWIVFGQGSAALLQPVGSWPISELFVERALIDYPALSFETIAKRALAVNPVGLARQLTRKGRIARLLFETMVRLENDAATANVFAFDLFEVAAARSIWADRDALPKALAALDKLPANALVRAQSELEVLGAYHGRVPDVLVVSVLLTAVGARRFARAEDWDWPAWITFHLLWTRSLRRSGECFHHASSVLRDAIFIARNAVYDSLLAAAVQLDDQDRAFEILSDVLERPTTPPFLTTLPLPEAGSALTWSFVFRRLLVLKGISSDDFAIAEDRDGAIRRFQMALVTQDSLPDKASLQQHAYVKSYVLSRKILFEEKLGNPLDDLDVIIEQIDTISSPFPESVELQNHRLFARATFVKKAVETGERQELYRLKVEESDIIAAPLVCHERILEILIWCNLYALGREGAERADDVDVMYNRFYAYAEGFPNSDILPSVLMRMIAARAEAVASLGIDVAPRLQTLVQHADELGQKFPDLANVQWPRASAWNYFAAVVMDDQKAGLRIATIVQSVDAFCLNFRDHLGIQSCRLSVWQSLSHYESRHGVSPDTANRIATQMTWAAKPFQSDDAILSLVAFAWEDAVFGWHRDPRAWRECERALRHLEGWRKSKSANRDGLYAQCRAWGSLLVVHVKRKDWKTMARLEPEALECVETTCSTYPDDQFIAEEIGFIFLIVAQGRIARNLDRAATEIIAERMSLMASQFSASSRLRDIERFVKRLLESQTALTHSVSRADLKSGSLRTGPDSPHNL